jgi:hypothetical protein
MKKTSLFLTATFAAVLTGSVLLGCDGPATVGKPAAEGKKGPILAPGQKSGDVQIRIDK